MIADNLKRIKKLEALKIIEQEKILKKLKEQKPYTSKDVYYEGTALCIVYQTMHGKALFPSDYCDGYNKGRKERVKYLVDSANRDLAEDIAELEEIIEKAKWRIK